MKWTIAATLWLAAFQDEPIERLIERLGDDDPSVREQAHESLAALSNVEILNRVAAEHSDPEVRARARNIVDRFTKVQWRANLQAALEEARRAGKKVLVFTAPADLDAPI
jgi:hypothetical protein